MVTFFCLFVCLRKKEKKKKIANHFSAFSKAVYHRFSLRKTCVLGFVLFYFFQFFFFTDYIIELCVNLFWLLQCLQCCHLSNIYDDAFKITVEMLSLIARGLTDLSRPYLELSLKPVVFLHSRFQEWCFHKRIIQSWHCIF